MLAEPLSLYPTRRLVQAVLESWNLPGLVDNARVIVNELTTNAMEAAPDEWMEVAIQFQRDRVLISVWDCCPDLPLATQMADLDAEGGRGLFVVALYAAKYGTDVVPERPGKKVWALLLTDQPGEEVVASTLSDAPDGLAVKGQARTHDSG
jgi:hypothetical protein